MALHFFLVTLNIVVENAPLWSLRCPWLFSHHPPNLPRSTLYPHSNHFHHQHYSSHKVLIHSPHVPELSQYSLIHSTYQLTFYQSSSTHIFMINSNHSWHTHQICQIDHLKMLRGWRCISNTLFHLYPEPVICTPISSLLGQRYTNFFTPLNSLPTHTFHDTYIIGTLLQYISGLLSLLHHTLDTLTSQHLTFFMRSEIG